MRFFSTITSIVQIPETPGRNWRGREEGQQEIGNVEKWLCLPIPSPVEIPTTKVDKSEVELSTTRIWNPELHLSTPRKGRNFSNSKEKGLAAKETPGINCRGREEDQQATDKVEQWLRFTNNPPPRTPAGIPEPSTGEEGDQQATDKVEQWLGLKNNIPLGTPTPTNEKNAIPNGSKTKDQLQKRRPGKINVSKSTLPHEATDAFERDVARSGAGMVVRDAAGKKVFFQDHSHSHPVSNSKSSRCTSALIHSQGQTFRAGCDWVDCNSPLISAPSLELPVRPASSLAASDRLRSKCKYEEAVAAAVRTAQLVAAETRRRHSGPKKTEPIWFNCRQR
jgi:hypothetical protein